MMKSPRKEKYYFSTPEEQEKFRKMPAMLKVWRATNDVNDRGISWTLSKEYAEKYAEIYDKKIIREELVPKCNVFAFIERNDESEIIIL